MKVSVATRDAIKLGIRTPTAFLKEGSILGKIEGRRSSERASF